MNICKCGCGKEIEYKSWHKYKKSDYIKGHGRKGKKNSIEHNLAIKKANIGRTNENPWNKGLTKKDDIRIAHSQKSKEKISKTCKKVGVGKWMNGKKLSEKTKQKISKFRTGYITPLETKKKISKANSGKNNGMYGKIFSKEERLNRRLNHIKYIQKTHFDGVPMVPTIGRNETKILDRIEKDLNIKIIRQYKVIGYFLDGYDKVNNIAYEVDEKHHFINKNQEKDIYRQKQIEEHLNCSFIRIKDLNQGEI